VAACRWAGPCEQPVDSTVDVITGTDAASITIGRMSSFFVPSPLVQYAVRSLSTCEVRSGHCVDGTDFLRSSPAHRREPVLRTECGRSAVQSRFS
jgi:hypothetical protein